MTLRWLGARAGFAVGCLSEIERGLQPGSAVALSLIAAALGTTIYVLTPLD